MGELVYQIKTCPRCGAELVQPDKNSSEWKCASCRSTFAPEVHKALSKQMAEIARNVVDEAFEEKIAEHRRNLWTELEKDITERSSLEIITSAQDIRSFSKDDIQANFYLVTIAERKAKPIVKFLNNLAKRDPDLYRHYVEDFVCFLTESFEVDFVMPLRALISKAFAEGSKEYKKCQDLVDDVARDKGTHNVREKRDVFVACSSKDKEIVWELVQYLESEDRTKESKGRSLSCFFYERNLPKGRKADQHYQDRLKEAIENCKVFLFASSQNSRTKDCDAYSEELSLLKEVRFANKERVEWILDSVDARLSTPDPDVCESIERIFKGNTWHIGTSKEDMQEVYNAIMQCLDYQSEKTSKTSVANVSSDEKKLAAFEYEKLSNGKYIIKKLKNSEELYVVVPDCVEIISQNTFADSGVIEVTLPEGLIRIGKGAFSGCQYLETINIPTSLTIIDEETFLNCTQLDLEPPSGVRCGKDAFKNTRYSIRVEEERKRKEDAESKLENTPKKPKQEKKSSANNISKKPVILYQSTKQEFSKDEYSRGFKMFLQDAESGNSEAQFYVAVCYENGFGTRKLNQKALEWYEKSAAQGDADANYYLGVIYESRLLGVKRELPKAFEYYKKASDQGHPMAKRLVGIYYLDGIKSYLRRTAKNIAQGIELLSELSANGDCKATKRLVKHYHRNSEYHSENEYLKWLRLAAEQGDADSQYWLALACKPNNIEESIEWYQKAAEQKHFCAAQHLGELYEERKDYESAIHWYNVDIEIGASTCYGSYCHLSWIYEHGLGVVRDDKKAALYRAKAEEKDAHSSANEFAKIREYYTNHERVMQSVNNVPYIKGSLRNIAKCAMLAITLGEISVVWIEVHLGIGYDSAKSILAQLEQLGYISQLDIYVKPFPSHKTLVSEDKFYRDLNNGVLGEIEK